MQHPITLNYILLKKNLLKIGNLMLNVNLMNINTIENTFIKPPHPIFVKDENDFSELCLALTEIIYVGNFMHAFSTDHIKIQV